MVKMYKCWRCHNHIRHSIEELIKRKETSKHIDYCCPICESVIICDDKTIKRS